MRVSFLFYFLYRYTKVGNAKNQGREDAKRRKGGTTTAERRIKRPIQPRVRGTAGEGGNIRIHAGHIAPWRTRMAKIRRPETPTIDYVISPNARITFSPPL